ncbi:MAG: hypothetical protein AB1633_12230 [Elusimicrobiota bacterium]
MAESKKQSGSKIKQVTPAVSGSISTRGKKVIGLGIIILAIGFFILSKTDPQGQNWASILSPFLIVIAYVLIGLGIVLPDKK